MKTAAKVMDWDDLQYVLAVARSGGLAGAAERLGVNHSSVYRRLENLEKSLGARLFERLRSGYRLTPHGQTLAEAAARMEVEALAVHRRLLGTDLKLSGAIRVGTSESLGLYLLPDLLRRFSGQFPDVTIELLINNRMVDLTRRDADVVVRATSNPPKHLVGRRVAKIAFCAYAHQAYLDSAGRDRPLNAYDWLGFDESLSRMPQSRWLRKYVPDARYHLHLDSIAAIVEAVRAGMGAAGLPCYVADAQAQFERIGNVRVEVGFGVWVLTHSDLRKSARIRAFIRCIGDQISAEQGRLLGNRNR